MSPHKTPDRWLGLREGIIKGSRILISLGLVVVVSAGCGPEAPPEKTSASSEDPDSTGTPDSTDSTTTDSSETPTNSTTDVPGQICGDGVVKDDEQCDDGNDNDKDGCTNDCKKGGMMAEGCDAFTKKYIECEIFPEGYLDELYMTCMDGSRGDVCDLAQNEHYKCIAEQECSEISKGDPPPGCKDTWEILMACD